MRVRRHRPLVDRRRQAGPVDPGDARRAERPAPGPGAGPARMAADPHRPVGDRRATRARAGGRHRGDHSRRRPSRCPQPVAAGETDPGRPPPTSRRLPGTAADSAHTAASSSLGAVRDRRHAAGKHGWEAHSDNRPGPRGGTARRGHPHGILRPAPAVVPGPAGGFRHRLDASAGPAPAGHPRRRPPGTLARRDRGPARGAAHPVHRRRRRAGAGRGRPGRARAAPDHRGRARRPVRPLPGPARRPRRRAPGARHPRPRRRRRAPAADRGPPHRRGRLVLGRAPRRTGRRVPGGGRRPARPAVRRPRPRPGGTADR
ncbi:hypothetical protein SGPA1_40945 [Streptomyces misionensis JCM 4497]